MKSPICEMLGIEFPLLGFNHCRDVIVEVSKAGGMGVLGAAGLSPEQLEIELNWIDAHIDGKPYGVDLIVPTSMARQDSGPVDIDSLVPDEHRNFAANILARHNIDTLDLYAHKAGPSRAFLGEDSAADIMEVAFSHPISLIANALGVPPRRMLEAGKARGVKVAALVGAKERAIKQAEAGHLAAGGIVTGRQMAACMAMGAHGAWTGSMWLTTTEAMTSQVIKEKFVAATSRQTVRSRSRTGKYSRQLRSPWTDAWEDEGAPEHAPSATC